MKKWEWMNEGCTVAVYPMKEYAGVSTSMADELKAQPWDKIPLGKASDIVEGEYEDFSWKPELVKLAREKLKGSRIVKVFRPLKIQAPLYLITAEKFVIIAPVLIPGWGT